MAGKARRERPDTAGVEFAGIRQFDRYGLPTDNGNVTGRKLMALSITNLKKGVLFQMDGVPYRVVDYNQKVMGRGGSIVNVRIKSVLDGKVLDKTFKGNETVESAEVTNQSAQYLYTDGDTFYFMNPDTFEQFEIPADLVGD